jgi:hypothetical protein
MTLAAGPSAEGARGHRRSGCVRRNAYWASGGSTWPTLPPGWHQAGPGIEVHDSSPAPAVGPVDGRGTKCGIRPVAAYDRTGYRRAGRDADGAAHRAPHSRQPRNPSALLPQLQKESDLASVISDRCCVLRKASITPFLARKQALVVNAHKSRTRNSPSFRRKPQRSSFRRKPESREVADGPRLSPGQALAFAGATVDGSGRRRMAQGAPAKMAACRPAPSVPGAR